MQQTAGCVMTTFLIVGDSKEGKNQEPQRHRLVLLATITMDLGSLFFRAHMY